MSLNKFEIGDEVVVSRDVAGMKRGETGTIINTLPVSKMYVLRMSDGAGPYNMLPEDLDDYWTFARNSYSV